MLLLRLLHLPCHLHGCLLHKVSATTRAPSVTTFAWPSRTLSKLNVIGCGSRWPPLSSNVMTLSPSVTA
ncbi:hypothetical protein PF008_g25935 [Phytophthora fragariae]|uniref:Secreted protein n=1 Tax=Phytophthora fragariae TaxID=53985 RepID=A0A6G0QJF8_9STRA|nr:hypothetical protein PF008_g25935 [Phytophthora fragariae]